MQGPAARAAARTGAVHVAGEVQGSRAARRRLWPRTGSCLRAHGVEDEHLRDNDKLALVIAARMLASTDRWPTTRNESRGNPQLPVYAAVASRAEVGPPEASAVLRPAAGDREESERRVEPNLHTYNIYI